MCGIVGYLGFQEPKKIIIDGLKKLEYRGYDSAGVAILHNGLTKRIRAEGKLKALEDKIMTETFNGHLGIGHTRWATHGAPVEKNAHPHQVGEISLVHNGIIENYLDIKKDLLARGAHISSDTDSELVAHLINEEIQKTPNLLLAVQKTLSQLIGAFSIVVMWEKSPLEMIAFKDGPPLIVGLGEKNNKKEFFIVSDVQAALAYTKDFVYLEDREVVHINDQEIKYFSALGAPLKKQIAHIDWNTEQVEKKGFKHFMLKEIYEQPQAVAAAIRMAKEKGALTLSITNVQRSSIDREAHGHLYMNSGTEVGVASTKAFTSTLALLNLLALQIGKSRGVLTVEDEKKFVNHLIAVPSQIEVVLAYDKYFSEAAKKLKDFKGFLYLGRGVSYPIALEGALKLKELAYLHAEGYAAGEMKHGPLALIDARMAIVVVAPTDDLIEKTISNLQEAKARGGKIISIGTGENAALKSMSEYYLSIPTASWMTHPMISVVPLQLMAYHLADSLGYDVDQPRNLAKSVTVE